MAPSTRSSAHASVTKKQPPARKPRATRQSSKDWTLSPRLEANHAEDTQSNDFDQDPLDQDDMEQPDFEQDHFDEFAVVQSRETPDLDTALVPLRQMADQVGREIETFAEQLDQYFGVKNTHNKFEAIMNLVQDYKQAAENAVKSLKKNHERDMALQLRREWNEREKIPTNSSALMLSSNATSAPSMTEEKTQQVRKLRKWQQEADLWELFEIMLGLHHNPDQRAVQKSKEEQLHELGHVHRYTSEDDLFTRFVLEDDVARERLLVKKWLEQTVDHQESDLSGITSELESKTSRGRGMWKNGWMHTREKIKGEKRTRSWSNAPGLPLPHVMRKDNIELLVTTLDPDAASRQQRALEKEDEYVERAMWIACWEMLRRGKSWEEVSIWCQNQREGWRALSLGMATDPADTLSKGNWRHMCYLASQADKHDDYEAAVYGLLGGGYSAVQKVSRNVDDKLYGYYSAVLVRQFDQYLATKFPHRAPPTRRGLGDDAVKDPQQQIVELIERLRKQPETSAESIQPMKIIQSYLLANDVGSLIHTMGYAVSYVQELLGADEQMIVRLQPFWPGADNQPELEVALDRQTLRMAVHMGIIMSELRDHELEDAERDAEENVTVAYIQALRAERNRDLIPLYASRLRDSRRSITMARTLEDVQSAGEQTMMLKLMHQHNMDVITILNEQLFSTMSKHLGPRLDNLQPFSMLEQTKEQLYPGQRIKLNLPGDKFTVQDNAVVGGLQWYNIVEGYWKETFDVMSVALRKCLLAGRIACALRIIDEFPYDALSKRKTYSVIGRSVNFMTYEEEPPNGQAGLWTKLRAQSRMYYDLSQIVEAISALMNYRQHEAHYTGKALKMSSAPQGLKEAKDEVDQAMRIVLQNDILAHPTDRDEAKDLEQIRTQYIPELTIAYNTVLHSAGATISRENLIQSMDLSVTVANDDSINTCFEKAGRMGELVKSFAATSKTMLILKAEGKPYRQRKEREGKDLGMWEIGQQSYDSHHELTF